MKGLTWHDSNFVVRTVFAPAQSTKTSQTSAQRECRTRSRGEGGIRGCRRNISIIGKDEMSEIRASADVLVSSSFLDSVPNLCCADHECDINGRVWCEGLCKVSAGDVE